MKSNKTSFIEDLILSDDINNIILAHGILKYGGYKKVNSETKARIGEMLKRKTINNNKVILIQEILDILDDN